MGKDLSVPFMLYVQGALNANSRFIIESWKSPVSNAENPSAAENGARPEKPKPTQLRETRDSAEETRTKLDVSKLFSVRLYSFVLANFNIADILPKKRHENSKTENLN